MKNIRIPSIRLDKTNVDAPTINRALDNIISNVNTFAAQATEAINALEAAPAGTSPVQDIQAGTGISVTEAPPGTFTITNTSPGGSTNVVAGSGISVVESPADTFTVTNTGALLSGPAQTFTNANTFAGAVTLGAGQTFTNNGTIAGGTVSAATYTNLPVDDIQAGSGIAVSESPAGTFTIINTAQGGGGGGGIVYYLNEAIAGDAPTPAAGYAEFGTTVQPAGSNLTATFPGSTSTPTLVKPFITDLNVPGVTTIPAGVWDFNVWLETNSVKPDEVQVRIRLEVWDGTTATPLSTSSYVFVTNHTTISQYVISPIVPQTTIAATDRIIAILEGRVVGSNTHTVTAYFGNTYPSHAHSTIPYDYVQTVTGGTGVTVTEPTPGNYQVAIGQPVATTDAVTFDVVTATSNVTSPFYTCDPTAASLAIKPPALATAGFIHTYVEAANSSAGIGSSVYILGGASTLSQGGDVQINGGAGAVTQGAVSIGQAATTRAVAIGRSGIFTNVSGTLNCVNGLLVAGTSFQINPSTLASGTGWTTQIRGGASSSGAGGILSLDAGSGTTGGGALNIGLSNAASLTIGRGGITTTMQGTVNASGFNLSLPAWGSITAPANVSITAAASQSVQFTSGSGASATLQSGTAATGNTGLVLLRSGAATAGTSGGLGISTGAGTTGTGSLSITVGNASAGTGGTLQFTAGNATGSTGDGGDVTIYGGYTSAATGVGGDVVIVAGNANSSTTPGNVIIDAGNGSGTNDGTISIGLGVNAPGGTTKAVYVGTNTVPTYIPNSVGTYGYAVGSNANMTIPGTSTPLTVPYNTTQVNGISINAGTGIFTVPATGLYRIQFTGLYRVFTNLASTYWVSFELYNVTSNIILHNFNCFKQVATSGNPVAYALGDSFIVNMNTTSNMTVSTDYSIRVKHSNTTGNLVVAWEPNLVTGTASRAGVIFRLDIERRN